MNDPLVPALVRVLCWLFSPVVAVVGLAVLAVAYGLVYIAITGRIPE